MRAPLNVLFVSPDQFRAKPQVGTPRVMAWADLVAYLSRPSSGDAKDIAGAWSPALYRENVRRKSSLVSVGALVVDVDEHGDVDEVACAVARYAAVVHETFSSTDDAPRCRLVLLLAESIDAAPYEATHTIVRAHLRAVGIVADEGAKDASRVSYAPVRRPGADYRFRALDGAPLDARAVLAAQPPPPPRPVTRLPRPEHADAYARAALRKAAETVAGTGAGDRHFRLCREAYALARLEQLSEDQIEAALLPPFVQAAGDARVAEGRRAIRDAFRARRGAS